MGLTLGAQISVNFPSLPVVPSPALIRLGNVRQEENSHCLGDFVQEIVIKSPNNTNEASLLQAGPSISGHFHCNYSDKTCLLA